MFLLQETHATKRLQKRWQCEWGGRVFFTHGLSNSKGVCIMFKRNSVVKVLNSERDQNGRIIALLIEFLWLIFMHQMTTHLNSMYK